MTYWRFAAMIATSTLVMFILMYLNTYAWGHVTFSETRVYMAILMGASMAIIMLGYMLGMYDSTKINIGIFIGSAIVFALSLWLVRSQATISGVSYMRAMIPHHSIAIMTSERAQITDPRVRKLADEIIEAQEREISEMRYLIGQLAGDEDAMRPEIYEAPPAEVATIAEALQSALVETLDPSPLNEAEAAAVLPAGPGCEFSRTARSDPILAVRTSAAAAPAAGLMKLNGKLVPLRTRSSAGLEELVSGTTLYAEGVRMSVAPVADDEPARENGAIRREADLVFELEQGLQVGYRGVYRCGG